MTRMDRRLPLLLFLLVAVVFGRSLGHQLVWDDHDLIARDPRVTGPLEPLGLFAPYWSASGLEAPAGASYARPLVTLSFALQHAVTGLEPAPLHAFNLLVHAAAVLLLFALLRELSGSSRAAGLSAALFAIFPTQVEPVAWISGRTDLLAGMFGLAAMLLHRRARRIDGASLLSGACLVCALLSKEIGWVFLPLLALQARIVQAGPTAPLRYSRWLPIAAAALLGAAARAASLGAPSGLEASSAAGPVWSIPLRLIASAGHYLMMGVWPWNPSALPAGRALPPPTSPILWSGLVALLWLLRALWRAHRQDQRTAELGIAWIGLGLLPVLNLVPLSAPSPVAERFWYVPLAGVALLCSLGLARAEDTRRRRIQGVTLAFLALYATVSGLRVPDWATDRTLWEAEAGRHGLRHPLAARNLGLARLQDGDVSAAEEVWREALGAGLGGGTPHYYDMGIDLGNLLVQQGRKPEAVTLAGQLLATGPPLEKRAGLLELLARARAP